MIAWKLVYVILIGVWLRQGLINYVIYEVETVNRLHGWVCAMNVTLWVAICDRVYVWVCGLENVWL